MNALLLVIVSVTIGLCQRINARANAPLVVSVSVLSSPLCADYMSLVMRKPVFGVSDQVPHKPGCTITEDGIEA